MQELIKKIEQWGYDRNLQTADPLMQTTKTLEEVIELQQAIISHAGLYENNTCDTCTHDDFGKCVLYQCKYLTDIKDAIGDIFVTLVMLDIQISRKIQLDISRIDFEEYAEYDQEDFLKILIDVYDLQNCVFGNHIGLIENSFKFLLTRLSGIANYYNFTLKECVEYAYEQIKDRKGCMENGLWVKESGSENKKTVYIVSVYPKTFEEWIVDKVFLNEKEAREYAENSKEITMIVGSEVN